MATKKGRRNKMNRPLNFNLYSSHLLLEKKKIQVLSRNSLPQTKTSCLLSQRIQNDSPLALGQSTSPSFFFIHSLQQQKQDMYFCPACSNLLLVQSDGTQRLYCQTCPYIYPIVKTVRPSLSRLAASCYCKGLRD